MTPRGHTYSDFLRNKINRIDAREAAGISNTPLKAKQHTAFRYQGWPLAFAIDLDGKIQRKDGLSRRILRYIGSYPGNHHGIRG
jgi:hypothetical protein